MRLKNEAIGNGLQLVPETYGMDVPSSCTIVIIAGENIKHSSISMNEWIKNCIAKKLMIDKDIVSAMSVFKWFCKII